MSSLPARALKLITRVTIRHEPASAADLVRNLRRSMNNPPPVALIPRSVRRTRFGNGGSVQGDWLQVKTAKRAILYLHGGGYIAGVTRTYHSLCARLASQLDADVFLPDYRLAPEHPFPAAVDDAVAAWNWLLDLGWEPEQIVIAGDSAGGGLTLALLLALRDSGRTLPAAAIAMSPFADMTATAGSHIRNDSTDAILSASMLAIGESLYVRDPEQRRHPHASPVFGDFAGLPPLLVTVSDDECLRDDAYAVVKRAQQANVPVQLINRPDLPHVWPIFWPLLPEARADVARMIDFVKRTVRGR